MLCVESEAHVWVECHKRGAPGLPSRHKPPARPSGRTSEIILESPQPHISTPVRTYPSSPSHAEVLTLGLASPEKAKTFSGLPSGIL